MLCPAPAYMFSPLLPNGKIDDHRGDLGLGDGEFPLTKITPSTWDKFIHLLTALFSHYIPPESYP